MTTRPRATILDCLVTAIAATAALVFVQVTIAEEQSAPEMYFAVDSDPAIVAVHSAP